MCMEKQKVIFSLVKAGLFARETSDLSELSEVQWEELYKELNEQTITGIPAEWIFAHIQLSEKLNEKWFGLYMQQVGFYYQLLYEQNELVRLMSEHHIPMAILKGTAAAMYYPEPSARLMGDIDFLVPPNEFQRAYHIMLENGYELKYDENNVDYHFTLQKNKFIYEIHKEPAGMPQGTTKEYLQQILDAGMHSLDMICLQNYKIPVLPSLQNGIVLILHIVKHLKSGLGLRQIIDWMMYVNKELDDEKWYTEMQPILHKVGFEKLAKAVTRMCQLYLGLRQNNVTWCLDIDEKLCEKLMEYIINQGNFGRKVMEEDKGIKILEEIHNPVQLFSLLQRRGENNWRFLEMHPWARSFAWMYMSCRYLRKIVQRKSPVKKLVTDIQGGSQRKELFEQLEFYY